MDAAEEQRVFLLLLDEIEETLADFEKRCLMLEQASTPADLKVIFRAAHNIKGGSRLFGLSDLGSFVHCTEELLSTLLSQQKPVDSQSIDLLLKSHSLLLEWTKLLRNDRAAVMNTADLRARIMAHNQKLKSGKSGAEAMAPAAGSSKETGPASGADRAPGQGTSPLPASSRLEAGDPGPESPLSNAEARGLSWKGYRPQKRKRTGNLKVSLPKIDEIMQLLGEISIHQSILWHGRMTDTLGSPVCQNAVALNQKVLKDIHNLVLSLRMQPVESLFQRLERAARDIARELGKTIQVVLSGAEVNLDKTVSEIMIDPMIHLIRNAVDHGIEPEERRRELGKPTPAKIEISASQDAGTVVLTVSDDGCGIDPRLVFKKAVEKGLISGRQTLTDNEIIQLIFAPGFSTRDQVTEISGRGVGMDIVSQAIQQIGGKIAIVSRPGHGTRFQVSLPTSLEVVDGLVIRVDQAAYIVPMQDVIEIIDLRSFNPEPIGSAGWAIQLHGAVVPVEALSEYIPTGRQAEAGDTQPIERKPALVIRLSDRRKLALAVDQVMAQQQIVVRPLCDKLAAIPGFTGATVLGNGEPGLILSVGYIGECYLSWVARARRTA